MKRRLRIATNSCLAIAVLLASLYWPGARWMEDRSSWLPVGTRVDAVYLMAGQQDRERVDGLLAWLKRGGTAGRVMLSRDPSKGAWSRADQRNLSTGEWTLRRLRNALEEAGLDVPVEVVTTDMRGTDAEVAALAELLRARPVLKAVALTTSRFHIRRTHLRARKYFDAAPGIVPGAAVRHDRLPWVVGAELMKMLRDALGLSRVVRRVP